MQTLPIEYFVKLTRDFNHERLRLPGYDRQHDFQSIKLLAADQNYTMVHLVAGTRPFMVCQTLKTFEHQMPGFIRVNKATLVNPNVVRKAVVLNPRLMNLELTSGESVHVSRRRIGMVLEQLSLPPILINVKSS